MTEDQKKMWGPILWNNWDFSKKCQFSFFSKMTTRASYDMKFQQEEISLKGGGQFSQGGIVNRGNVRILVAHMNLLMTGLWCFDAGIGRKPPSGSSRETLPRDLAWEFGGTRGALRMIGLRHLHMLYFVAGKSQFVLKFPGCRASLINYLFIQS